MSKQKNKDLLTNAMATLKMLKETNFSKQDCINGAIIQKVIDDLVRVYNHVDRRTF